jgi:hypothetical protein
VSAHPVYHLTCDYPGCGKPFTVKSDPATDIADTAAAVRAWARSVGWRVGVPSGEFPPRPGRSRLDYCSDHASLTTEGTPR